MRLNILVLVTIYLPLCFSYRPRPNILKRKNPSYRALTDDSLTSLSSLTDLDEILDFDDPKSLLSQTLVPRVAGSSSLRKIQDTYTKFFQDLKWKVEKDSFSAETPYGPRSFTNLIFTHDPEAPLQLILSAHIDSKFYPTSPDDGFVGATDSAAPCAILADVAKALTPWLDARRERVKAMGGEEGGNGGQREGLKIVLFDGEEAFKDWTSTDSIYGAKHLAELWSEPITSPSATSPPMTTISSISHLILLDLLGAAHPVIRSFYPQTNWFFDEFLHSESRLGTAGHLFRSLSGNDYTAAAAQKGSKEASFFVNRKDGPTFYGGGIEDDHIPFVHKGVNVVHLIPLPFPNVWHTLKDDVTALDLPTIKAWALIVRLTVAEYLGLDPEAGAAASKEEVKRKVGRNELILEEDGLEEKEQCLEVDPYR